MPNPNRGSCGFQSTEFEQEYDRPSKSQLKREMTELQKLGADLVAEPRERVKRVPMPEDVRDAILECQTITNHEGRRRQMQYVGKKMRSLDAAEVEIIQNMGNGLFRATIKNEIHPAKVGSLLRAGTIPSVDMSLGGTSSDVLAKVKVTSSTGIDSAAQNFLNYCLILK